MIENAGAEIDVVIVDLRLAEDGNPVAICSRGRQLHAFDRHDRGHQTKEREAVIVGDGNHAIARGDEIGRRAGKDELAAARRGLRQVDAGGEGLNPGLGTMLDGDGIAGEIQIAGHTIISGLPCQERAGR